MSDDKEKQTRDAAFAKILNRYTENPPSEGAQFIGHMMRDWLITQIADPGTGVDTGGGFYTYDLWVTVEGVEHHIAITRKVTK
jgi:hypothetical protein